MDCLGLREELLAYHLATLDDGERARVEDHLLRCAGCLRTYLQLKRAAESPPPECEDDGRLLRPSSAVRIRLRAEVVRTFRPPLLSHLRRIAARPVPLYQVAIAALLLALIGVAPSLLRAVVGPGGGVEAVPAVRVDVRVPSPRRGGLGPWVQTIDTSRIDVGSETYF